MWRVSKRKEAVASAEITSNVFVPPEKKQKRWVWEGERCRFKMHTNASWLSLMQMALCFRKPFYFQVDLPICLHNRDNIVTKYSCNPNLKLSFAAMWHGWLGGRIVQPKGDHSVMWNDASAQRLVWTVVNHASICKILHMLGKQMFVCVGYHCGHWMLNWLGMVMTTIIILWRG